MPDPCPDDLVRSVIVEQVSKWQWQLATVDELVSEVCSTRDPNKELTPKEIGYLLVGAYGCRLHAAVGRKADQSLAKIEIDRRQERAFIEIGRYLYILARGRGYTDDEAEEAVQAALYKIYLLYPKCKKPAAFLSWCWWILRGVLPGRDRRVDAPIDDPDPSDPEDAEDRVDANAVDPEHRAICVALWKQFLSRIEGMCAGDAKRARRQIAAVLFKFIADLSDVEIADRLGTSVANVQVLRAHGLRRLMKDKELMQIAQELRDADCGRLRD